jgi:ABC transport system ATP-binding/permease protein
MVESAGLQCRYLGRDIVLDPGRRSSIGTDLGCDMVLDGTDGGATWATVRMLGGWHLQPLDGTEVSLENSPWSGRLTKLDGNWPLSVRLRHHGSEAHFNVTDAPADTGPTPVADPAPADAVIHPATGPSQPPPTSPITIPATAGVGGWITIGRTGGPADLPLPGPDVALRHARFRRQADGSLDLRDLSHGLGVFINGHPMLIAKVRAGESFVIGHHQLVVGSEKLALESVRQSPVLECRQLTATYQQKGWMGRKAEPSLSDIDFVLNADEFTAVIGPSGVGKSTLFRVLLGEMTDVHGSVRFSWGALDAAGPPGNLMSFVPQDDHLPSDLTAGEAIWFAARLRLAPDLPRTELRQRVHDVMTRLDLTEHADTDIRELSGGTRKRVSVALELLSDPVLLMLDEPTSGLDEGLDRRLVKQLVELADKETAILLVTHSTANLEQCDQVLAINGRRTVGYCGPPKTMRETFGTDSYADVMDSLREGKSVAAEQPGTGLMAAIPEGRIALRHARRRQIPVLALRELRRFVPVSGGGRRFAKPAEHLLVAPLFVALFACLVGPRGLATTAAAPNASLTQVLPILSISAAFFAAALTSGSIVSDFEMIKREARWGIRTRSVVLSRFCVFGLVALLEGVLASLFFLYLFRRPGPSDGGLMPGPLLMIVTLSLLSMTSAVAGLFVSSLARSVQQSAFALMLLSVIQVVLSGLLIPLGRPTGPGIWSLNALSWVTPIRWAAVALGSGIGINQLPGITPDGLWTHNLPHVAGAWLAMLALSALYLMAAAATLSLRVRRRL